MGGGAVIWERRRRGEIDGRQETELYRFNWPHFIAFSPVFTR